MQQEQEVCFVSDAEDLEIILRFREVNGIVRQPLPRTA